MDDEREAERETAKTWRRGKRMKKLNYTKVKKGMRSGWGRERWWETDGERKGKTVKQRNSITLTKL